MPLPNASCPCLLKDTHCDGTNLLTSHSAIQKAPNQFTHLSRSEDVEVELT